MLKLLLDEHISPEVAKGLRQRHPRVSALSLAEWEQGSFMGLPDEIVLKEAAAQGFTLVTYDLRTIPPLLKIWAEAGRDHGGVIFVDGKTISPSDFGSLIHALGQVLDEGAKSDWANRVIYLRR